MQNSLVTFDRAYLNVPMLVLTLANCKLNFGSPNLTRSVVRCKSSKTIGHDKFSLLDRLAQVITFEFSKLGLSGFFRSIIGLQKAILKLHISGGTTTGVVSPDVRVWCYVSTYGVICMNARCVPSFNNQLHLFNA